jgi:hypothetical protein
MGKALGKAALLGGAALLASRMMGKDKEGKKEAKTESKEDTERDARESAIASMSKKREVPTETGAGAGAPRDRLADLEKTTPRAPTRAAPRTAPRTAPRGDASRVNEIPPPMTQSMEGAMASGLPREARGVRTAGSAGRDPSRFGTPVTLDELGFKKGGAVKSSASKRADGICKKGKTKGRMV